MVLIYLAKVLQLEALHEQPSHHHVAAHVQCVSYRSLLLSLARRLLLLGR